MPIQPTVIPSNLGKTIKPQHLALNKFDVNIDNASIVADANGMLTAVGTSITPTVTVGHDIATLLNSATGVSTQLKETIIKVIDAVNTVTITDEAGVDKVSTKISTIVNTFDPVAKTFVTTINGVASNISDVSAQYLDIKVNSIDSSNAANYIWTFEKSDGTTLTLNLASLVAIFTANTATVTLAGNGTTATPLTASVKLDPATTNGLTLTPAGVMMDKTTLLSVEVQDAFGVVIGRMGTV